MLVFLISSFLLPSLQVSHLDLDLADQLVGRTGVATDHQAVVDMVAHLLSTNKVVVEALIHLNNLQRRTISNPPISRSPRRISRSPLRRCHLRTELRITPGLRLRLGCSIGHHLASILTCRLRPILVLTPRMSGSSKLVRITSTLRRRRPTACRDH